MAGGGKFDCPLASIKFGQRQNLLENRVLQQIALERELLSLQLAHALFNRLSHLLVELVQLQDKESQPQQFKALHLFWRGKNAVDREIFKTSAGLRFGGLLFGVSV